MLLLLLLLLLLLSSMQTLQQSPFFLSTCLSRGQSASTGQLVLSQTTCSVLASHRQVVHASTVPVGRPEDKKNMCVKGCVNKATILQSALYV